MEALRAWARSLITLAVLAGLIDIILPRSNLQRPARLVLGLMLLLAILAPALAWRHQGLDWKAMLAEPALSVSTADTAGRAARLQQTTAEATRQELQRRLELTAEVAARQVEGVAGARARVTLAAAGPGQTPTLTGVELWLRTGAPGSVVPVAPVAVGAPPAPSGSTAEEAALAAQAIRAVAQALGVPSGRVTARIAR